MVFGKKILLYSLLLLTVVTVFLSSSCSSLDTTSENTRLGVWITVFSPEKVLHSKDNVNYLIEVCKRTGINDIYIQLYRADKAYYDSDITDRTPHENVLRLAGEDIIPYLIDQADKNGIKVHAWVNLLSLAQNQDANILKVHGESVLTKDQHGKLSMPLVKGEESNDIFLREKQLFLEPGDWRVRKYLSEIVVEILTKYPALSGLHLDYIRYPSTVPFIPGSRFTSNGISYGYNRLNLANFKTATGLDPHKMEGTRENFTSWDSWRREQVTKLVGYISERARKVSPSLEISATIVPSIERSYLVTFQDWTQWLKSGYVDYIVAMNYTDDTHLMELKSRSLLIGDYRDKMYIGVGAYILKESPRVLEEQLIFLKKLSPGGIVIFSYDEVAASKDLQEFLTDNFGKK